MSTSAIIRKGEILIKRWESPEYKITSKESQTLSDILQLRLEMEETSFGQFFSLIAKEADFFEKLFQCAMMGHPISPYVDECAKPAVDKKDMDYVEVGWSTELFENDFDHYVSFGGWGPWGTQTDGVPDKGGIALEFTPLYEYKDLELKLDSKVTIYDLSGTEPGKPIKIAGTGAQKFTVYDVVCAILDEITWAGDISKGRHTDHEDLMPPPSEAAA
jgi:hypothetical protein